MGAEVTGGPPAVEQLHRGAVKSRTGSEAQRAVGLRERSEGSGVGETKSSCLNAALGRPWVISESQDSAPVSLREREIRKGN